MRGVRWCSTGTHRRTETKFSSGSNCARPRPRAELFKTVLLENCGWCPDSSAQTAYIVSQGVDRTLLRRGQNALANARFAEAESQYLQSLNHHFSAGSLVGTSASIPEKRGSGQSCSLWLMQSVDRVLKEHLAATPDPFEWSYLIRSALCRGDVALAEVRARTYSAMRHLDLDRMRWVIEYLREGTVALDTCRSIPTERAWMFFRLRLQGGCRI